MLQTVNEKDFTNNKLKSFIEGLYVESIFGEPCHPQVKAQ